MLQLLLISSSKNDYVDFEELVKEASPKTAIQYTNPSHNGEIIQLLSEARHELVLMALESDDSDNQNMRKELVKRFSKIPFILICNVEQKKKRLRPLSLVFKII